MMETTNQAHITVRINMYCIGLLKHHTILTLSSHDTAVRPSVQICVFFVNGSSYVCMIQRRLRSADLLW